MRHGRILAGRLAVGILSLLCLVNDAQAQPNA